MQPFLRTAELNKFVIPVAKALGNGDYRITFTVLDKFTHPVTTPLDTACMVSIAVEDGPGIRSQSSEKLHLTDSIDIHLEVPARAVAIVGEIIDEGDSGAHVFQSVPLVVGLNVVPTPTPTPTPAPTPTPVDPLAEALAKIAALEAKIANAKEALQ